MYKYFYSVSNNEGLGDGYNNIKDNAVDYQFGLLHEVFENIVNKKIEIDNTYYKPNDYKMFINSNGYLNVIMNPIHGICAGAAYCEGVAGLEIIEIN